MGRLIYSMSVSLDGFVETPSRCLGRPDGPGFGIELDRADVDRHAAGRRHPRAAA
jgi:hypothetical protein